MFSQQKKGENYILTYQSHNQTSMRYKKICMSHGYASFPTASTPFFFLTFLLFLYQKSSFTNVVFRFYCHVSFHLFYCMIFSVCAQNKRIAYPQKGHLQENSCLVPFRVYIQYSVNINRFSNHLQTFEVIWFITRKQRYIVILMVLLLFIIIILIIIII